MIISNFSIKSYQLSRIGLKYNQIRLEKLLKSRINAKKQTKTNVDHPISGGFIERMSYAFDWGLGSTPISRNVCPNPTYIGIFGNR